MKKTKLIALALVVILIGVMNTGCASAPASKPADAKTDTKADTKAEVKNDWKLAWSDEFNGKDGTGVDTSKWAYETGGDGWGNSEREYYTDRTDNVYQENGSLVICAKKESYKGSEYTSGRIKTQGKFEFTYGKVEMKAKLPFGQGMWPAFWMLGKDIDTAKWPDCGELDIMELIGKDPAHIQGTIHGPGYSGALGIGTKYTDQKGFSDAYHTFAVEWEPNVIRWYCDGNLYATKTPDNLLGHKWVYDHDFFIILNLAVGGQWPGYPDDTTVFPQKYYIDYVRVYQRNEPSPAPSAK